MLRYSDRARVHITVCLTRGVHIKSGDSIVYALLEARLRMALLVRTSIRRLLLNYSLPSCISGIKIAADLPRAVRFRDATSWCRKLIPFYCALHASLCREHPW